MKKILLTSCMFFLLSCELKFNETKANTTTLIGDSKYFSVGHSEYRVDYTLIEIEGMEYAVFNGASQHPYGGIGVSVVNLTKDKLEIQLLKKQLNGK